MPVPLIITKFILSIIFIEVQASLNPTIFDVLWGYSSVRRGRCGSLDDNKKTDCKLLEFGFIEKCEQTKYFLLT